MNSEDRHGQARMICPRCGIEQARAKECANCGVVVAKWKANKERGPRVRQAGIGALLVLGALGLVLVAVVLIQRQPAAPEVHADIPQGVTGTAGDHVMDEFWSTGSIGFKHAVDDQQERKVPMVVWFTRDDGCPECVAVEQGIFGDREVRGWMAQNIRVRIAPAATPDNQSIADRFGVTTLPAAYVVRSDGARRAIDVFQAGTTTPRPAAEWLAQARELANR